MIHDPFRPRGELAGLLYDKLQSEARHRKQRDSEVWQREELEAVLDVAVEYAKRHGVQPPSVHDVKEADRCACGHSDYASKLALYVAEKVMAGHDS